MSEEHSSKMFWRRRENILEKNKMEKRKASTRTQGPSVHAEAGQVLIEGCEPRKEQLAKKMKKAKNIFMKANV